MSRLFSRTLVVVLAMLTLCPAAAGGQARPPLTADDLFGTAAIHDLALTVNTRDWRDLKEKYLENTYYLADLKWRGLTVRNVGIRSRGAGSRSGSKPGLRLDFDRYSASQEFLGLKSLVLDNLTQDPTMVKERVAMRFFSEMGIPAPRVAHVRLIVNNAFAGLYTVVEPIDKRFLARQFGENDGYLYEFKYVDRYGFGSLGDELDAYAAFFEPKTRESASTFDLYRPILELTRAINDSPDDRFVEVIGPFIDLHIFLTQLAVETFLSESDGILGDWGMNNFYLYRFEDSPRFQLLPWDKDSTFRTLDQDIYANVSENVLARRVLADPALRAFYEDALRKCAELAMRPEGPSAEGSDEEEPEPSAPGPGWLEREVWKTYEQINSIAAADALKPFSNEQFDEEMGKLLEFARERAGIVNAKLGGSVVR